MTASRTLLSCLEPQGRLSRPSLSVGFLREGWFYWGGTVVGHGTYFPPSPPWVGREATEDRAAKGGQGLR